MSTYYVVFERVDGEKLVHDAYNVDFEHEEPTPEEMEKAYIDILGGLDKGTIIFMQKLYSSNDAPNVMETFVGDKEETEDERTE